MTVARSRTAKVAPNYAANEGEAIDRAKKWREDDPFDEEVAPSLLSSNEIAGYVKTTAMLFPFDEEHLKTASYSVGFGKFAYQFDEDGGYIETELSNCENGLLRLPANSIVFVQCDTHFRLPKYMALRFNLRIKHVHRGMLLGTGPLVDPGFDGELLVPLHNLTSKDHYVEVSSHLIWIEFTKTTYKKPKLADADDLAKFDDRKKNLGPKDYLDDARKSLLNGSYLPIQSSINGVMKQSIQTAKKALKTANRTEKTLWGFGLLSVVGVTVAVIAFMFTFVQATYEQVDEVRQNLDVVVTDHAVEIEKIDAEANRLGNDAQAFEADLGKLRRENADLKNDILSLSVEMDSLSEQIELLTEEKVAEQLAE